MLKIDRSFCYYSDIQLGFIYSGGYKVCTKSDIFLVGDDYC